MGQIPAFQDTSGVKLFLETSFASNHAHALKQPKIIVKLMLEKPVGSDSVYGKPRRNDGLYGNNRFDVFRTLSVAMTSLYPSR